MSEKDVEEQSEDSIEKSSKEAVEQVEEATEEVIKAVKEASEEIEEAAKRIMIAGEETLNLKAVKGAPVVGKTVREIDELGFLGKDALLVEIKRRDKTIAPRGDTIIKAGDKATVFSPSGISDKTKQAFTEKTEEKE